MIWCGAGAGPGTCVAKPRCARGCVSLCGRAGLAVCGFPDVWWQGGWVGGQGTKSAERNSSFHKIKLFLQSSCASSLLLEIINMFFQ